MTTKQAMAVFGGLCTVVSFARVAVSFLEALAAVRDERNQDAELLDLCSQGSARASAKMRQACLQAQADRASPILLKAVLRAVTTAFEDFSEAVSSPGKVAILVLFIAWSVLFGSSWARALIPADPHAAGAQHVVVLTHNSDALEAPRMGFKRRVQQALRFRGSGALHDADEDEEFGSHIVEVSPVAFHHKRD